ncbi:hypothetical protein VaNZ11_012537 [Volvox africanus]|uniref:Uncharacterized protein n=1 Tax=Volvox africanus TaxID=51714 RepID=A0ABQ5SG75_9CHLO|nr:hypothetical protein VaNZ11_012537 [Volvox africanus]
MFSLGCGAIMHCYSDSWGQHRDVFRSKYLNVLDFIFGNQGVQEGSISHVPTNLELVSTVGRRLRTMSRVLSNGDNSASAATFSPLPRSTAHSQADGLNSPAAGAGASAESSFATVGHNHHGGHGYSRYLQLQQQRHQQHQQVLQQVGTGKGSSGSGLAERGTGGGGEGGSTSHGRLHGSLSLGATSGKGKPPGAPSDSRSGSNPVLSLSGKPAGSGESPLPFCELAVVVLEAKEEAEGEEVAGEATLHPHIDRMGAEVGTGSAAAANPATAAAGATAGRSAGGSSSHSSSEWEDVWASATGTSPNAAAAPNAIPAAATATSPRCPLPAASLQAQAHVAAATAVTMPRISSAPLVGGNNAVRKSPFVAPPSQGALLSPATAAAIEAPAPTTLSWAARLMAGAFHRSANGAPSSGNDAVANGSAMPMVVGAVQHEGVALMAAGVGATAKHNGGDAGGSLWAVSRRSSMRRISTAPHGMQGSAQALLLLSDRSSEHCGHGRSSYKELQRLSGGGESLVVAAELASGNLAAAMADPDVASPASSSSTSPEAVEAAVALFPASPTSPPSATGQHHGSLPSSPSGRCVVPPSRARPVPVPNANSRTPAFRSRKTSTAAGMHSAAGSTTTLHTSSLPRGSNSLGSSINRLLEIDDFSIRSVRPGSAPNKSAPENGSQNTIHKKSSRFGGGSALTFEPHGALSHPSPVPIAPVWPRMSMDTQGSGTVSRSAPEAREGVLAAVLAKEGGSMSALAGLDLEVEVGTEGELQ